MGNHRKTDYNYVVKFTKYFYRFSVVFSAEELASFSKWRVTNRSSTNNNIQILTCIIIGKYQCTFCRHPETILQTLFPALGGTGFDLATPAPFAR